MHSPPSPPLTPDALPTDSIKPYTRPEHFRTRSGTRRASSPSEYTPLVDLLPLLPQIKYIAEPPLSQNLAAADTARNNFPLRILFCDLLTLINTAPYLPYALRPLHSRSKPHHEDKDKRQNEWFGDDGNWRTKRDDTLEIIVSLLQLISLPVLMLCFLMLPGLVFWLVVAILGTLNWLILMPLRGTKIIQSTTGGYERAIEATVHKDERWFFINGIMTSCHGVQAAINEISRIFGRPVTGIHNWSYGFFGDIGECLIQRCFSYSTLDGRVAYDNIRYSLVNPNVKKVVLFAHSQGGIVASLVIDKLLTDLPRDCFGKLTIHKPSIRKPTLKASSSHLSATSSWTAHLSNVKPNVPNQEMQIERPFAEDRKKISHQFTSSHHQHPAHLYSRSHDLPRSPIHNRTSRVYIHQGISRSDSNLPSQPQPSPLEGSSAPRPKHRTIPYIEHYVNEYDPVPRWGLLHSIYDLLSPCYAGRVFIRLGASGHLFSKHYLAALFPPDEGERRLFWDREVLVDEQLAERRLKKEQGHSSDVELPRDVRWGDGMSRGKDEWDDMEERRRKGALGEVELGGKGKKVWELGRLWSYVDGGVPTD